MRRMRSLADQIPEDDPLARPSPPELPDVKHQFQVSLHILHRERFANRQSFLTSETSGTDSRASTLNPKP